MLIFYKVFKAEKFGYSFLFSNIIDSTYADGMHSVAHIECGEWKIFEPSTFVIDSLPVCMHNVDEKYIYRPAAWNAFGMDKEGQDYRACAAYGPLYKNIG